MGVGTPVDLVKNVARGIDMFDCVMPTRNARNGQLFTSKGKINIRNSKYKNDFNPINNGECLSKSSSYSKAYLHHLFKTEEILGYRIATEHNLRFYIQLMEIMHHKIKKSDFQSWANEFIIRYNKSEF